LVLKKCLACGFKVRAARVAVTDDKGRVLRHSHIYKEHKVPSGEKCSGSGREAPKEKNRQEESEFDIL
jgi:hypothetical protein